MEYITVTAKTVDDAITEALIQLGVTSDRLDYKVIEVGSKGFLGIGVKQAVIQARRKEEEKSFEQEVEEMLSAKEEKPSKTFKSEKREKPEKREKAPKTDRPVKAEKPAKSEQTEAPAEQTQKPEKEKSEGFEKSYKKDGYKKNNKKRDNRDYKNRDRKRDKKPVPAPVKEEPVIKKEIELAEVEPQTIEACEKFLRDVLGAMDMGEVNIVSAVDEEGALSISLDGKNMGILIGKRGQTLDSLQYLTNRVANKMQEGYVRVKLDTEDYRSRRKETLENLARNIAAKVKRTRRTVSLEPMNPYERRIIHSALQADPNVATHSEGEEPYRRVVVTLVRNK